MISQSLSRMKSIYLLSAPLTATLTPLAQADGLPKPLDVPYPGLVRVEVDATDLAHHVFWVHESIPVTTGIQSLLFPEWVPGTHGKSASAAYRLAGLHLSAAGRALEWRRDSVEMSRFR